MDEIEVREVCGGHTGSSNRQASLSELEDRMAAVRQTQADTEATLTRVEEAEAAYAQAREQRRANEAFVREASTARWGQAVADALLPPRTTARVRESVHPLGHVITGPHSHGSVRHDHPRLPYDHLHCPSCGSDTRLCLENPHHEPGAIPAREANTAAEPNAFVDAIGRIFDGETSPVTPGQAMAQVWQMEQATRERSGHEGKQLGAAFERAIGDGGPRR